MRSGRGAFGRARSHITLAPAVIATTIAIVMLIVRGERTSRPLCAASSGRDVRSPLLTRYPRFGIVAAVGVGPDVVDELRLAHHLVRARDEKLEQVVRFRSGGRSRHPG